ncbi:hypothetical protein FHG87_003443 [Trinorchestia longiramus]|nr:hypothetical protein FHG87_003443 [Trinorchestia longiramus]
MRDHRPDGRESSRSRRNSHEEGGGAVGGVVGSELHGATLKLLLPSPISPRPGDRAPSPQMRNPTESQLSFPWSRELTVRNVPSYAKSSIDEVLIKSNSLARILQIRIKPVPPQMMGHELDCPGHLQQSLAFCVGHSMRHKPDGSSSGGSSRPRRFSQDEASNPLKLTLPSPRASHRSPSPNPQVQASSSLSHGSPLHSSHSPSHTTPMTPPQTPTSISPPSAHYGSARHPSPLQLQPQQLLQHQQHIPQHQPSPLSPRLKDPGNPFVISDVMVVNDVVIPPPVLPVDIATTSVSPPPPGTPTQDFLPPTSRLSTSPVATQSQPSSFGLPTSDHSMDKLDSKSAAFGYGNQSLYPGSPYGYTEYSGFQGDEPVWRQSRASTSATAGEAKAVARTLERKMSLSGAADMGGFDHPSIAVTAVSRRNSRGQLNKQSSLPLGPRGSQNRSRVTGRFHSSLRHDPTSPGRLFDHHGATSPFPRRSSTRDRSSSGSRASHGPQ